MRGSDTIFTVVSAHSYILHIDERIGSPQVVDQLTPDITRPQLGHEIEMVMSCLPNL